MNRQVIINQKQQGMTLVLSMVMLITVLFLTITTMNVTINATKVTSNNLSEIQANLAAEAAIEEAEELINNGDLSTSDFTENCSEGLCTNLMDGNVWDNNSAWTNAKSTTGSIYTKGNLQSAPKFIIEYLGDKSSSSDTISVGQGYSDNNDTSSSPVYRITGKAKGKHGNKEAVIQSTIH